MRYLWMAAFFIGAVLSPPCQAQAPAREQTTNHSFVRIHGVSEGGALSIGEVGSDDEDLPVTIMTVSGQSAASVAAMFGEKVLGSYDEVYAMAPEATHGGLVCCVRLKSDIMRKVIPLRATGER